MLGMLLFALATQTLIDKINANCKIEYNFWCADDGNIFGDVDLVASIPHLPQRRTKMQLFLVKKKTSVWWPTMDTENLRKNFDCSLNVDKDDHPLESIVLVGSPVVTEDFVAAHIR